MRGNKREVAEFKSETNAPTIAEYNIENFSANPKTTSDSKVDSVHINADFRKENGSHSDHDPVIVQLKFPTAPTPTDTITPVKPTTPPFPDKPNQPKQTVTLPKTGGEDYFMTRIVGFFLVIFVNAIIIKRYLLLNTIKNKY